MPLDRLIGRFQADWREEAAYAPLLAAGRPAFAWEWLRRDSGYRRTALGRAGPPASAWGLHEFEPPEHDFTAARPMWLRSAWPMVLEADALGGGAELERLDISGLGRLVSVRRSCGVERLLLSDGAHSIRLDLLSGTLLEGPALLRYRIAGLVGTAGPLLALRQLLALSSTGSFSKLLHRPERRAARWVLVLRAFDAMCSGADQRAIAEGLLDRRAGIARWRIAEPSLRSRAQRLVREAKRMASGGYRDLLRGPPAVEEGQAPGRWLEKRDFENSSL
ncbi:MAG TPA: DUF2285 domain-containing protein [Sphingomicrobium sp.]|nr:DUF2285 domain-containing protein [Sphingomicrobium sp.]